MYKLLSFFRTKTVFQKQLWLDYTFHKQGQRELSYTYKKDRRTIRRLLETYTPPNKIHQPRAIHLVVDGTYWGERKQDTDWCSIVGRDPYQQEDFWWSFPKSETTSEYRRMRADLESLGDTILSVTGDGFGGIKQAFSGIPYQMCQVHMERLVVKGTTRKPQLEASIVLLALVRSLYDTNSPTFRTRLNEYIVKYRDFLNEQSINTETGRMEWAHRGVRDALRSLVNFRQYLFTFEQNRQIPPTTNSIEGHFSHIDDVIGVHRGISRDMKEKVLQTFFLLGTIAPGERDVHKLL